MLATRWAAADRRAAAVAAAATGLFIIELSFIIESGSTGRLNKASLDKLSTFALNIFKNGE
jgi:hypothetical protein